MGRHVKQETPRPARVEIDVMLRAAVLIERWWGSRLVAQEAVALAAASLLMPFGIKSSEPRIGAA